MTRVTSEQMLQGKFFDSNTPSDGLRGMFLLRDARRYWGCGNFKRSFHDSSLYGRAGEESSKRQYGKTAPFSQPHRQFSRSARLNSSTPSERLPERSPNTLPVPDAVHLTEKQERTRLLLRGESQAGEDTGDGGRFFNGRNEPQLPTTMRASLDVDIEHPLSLN